MARESTFWKEFDVNPETGLITVEVAGGQKFVLDINAQSPGNRMAAMFHGYVQKIRDAAAVTIYTKNPDGSMSKRPGTAEEKAASVMKVYDVLKAGIGDVTSWRAVREAGDKSLGLLDIQTRALVAYGESIGKAKPFEVVREKLKAMNHVDRMKFVTSPAVLPFFQAAQGADGGEPDADALFD